MSRIRLCLVVAITIVPSVGVGAQSANQRAQACDSYSGRHLVSFCSTQERMVDTLSEIDIDAGRNGGIRVRGWDRGGIRVRMRAIGQATTAARAQEIASAVNLSIVGSVIRADGPSADAGEHWAAEFDVDVPDDVMMKLRAHNGEISLDNVLGSGEFQTDNGAIRLSGVNGDLRGTTRNGGVEVTLRGRTWIGAGLDVSTRNGRVELFIPTDYSAELETGTVNGDLEADVKFATDTGRSGRVRTALGNGGSPIRVLTRNGKVTLTQR